MGGVSDDWLEAERRIEEARVSGGEVLDLSHLDIKVVPVLVAELERVSIVLLESCFSLVDLTALQELPALQSLNLSDCPALSDLSSLASLPALQFLNLSGCQALSSLSLPASLPALQSLNLSWCDALSDLSPLASLTTLQSLNLSGCRTLSDLSPLTSLTALQSLVLSECDVLSNLSPLASLLALQSLDLSRCDALSNLAPLASLTALQSLDLSGCSTLGDLAPLASLLTLQSLDLRWCEALSDLSPLASLCILESLNLRGCEALGDLSPLLKLPALRTLHLPNSIALSCQPGSSILDTAVGLKTLHCNNLLIAPNELASQQDHFYPENCLPRLKAWRADLDQGQADNHRIKLFVLGNGSAGKTQICRRLNDQAFDPSTPSTHGIDLGRVTLIPASEDKQEVIAHVWDFGGQDIYHGTHALFMDERALFVIVWNPELEIAQPYTEHGVAMRHRPLTYWLAMVRDVAGEDAAVVVVQSKCDRQQDSVQPPLPVEHGLRYLRYTACSAKNQSGMNSLLTSIQDQAQLLLERYGQVLLPASWVAVGDTLRARCSEGLRTLPRAEFETLCRAHHASAPPEVVLHYLHRSGEVFYRPGLFGDQLILNQQWALDGVYAVLERQCSLPLLHRQEGRFDQETLDALVWRGKYSLAEQALFVSLMEQCGACFPVNDDGDHLTQTSYLASDLLPERHEVQKQIDRVWREAETHLEVWLNYRFLHDGLMKELLCAIGRRAGVHAVYWRYGVCFFDKGMQATFLLEAQPDINPQQPGAGQLVWQVHVAQVKNIEWVQRWLEDLLQTVTGKAQSQQPEVIWRHQLGQASERDNEAYMDADDSNPIHRLQPGSQPDAKPTVYVSYGWGETNTTLLELLETAFTQRGYQLIYDKRKMRTGDWISAFKREIGHSRHVLVLLDEKYLRSWHCMNELQYLYDKALQEKSAFLRRIVPCVLQALPIDDGLARDKYCHFWATKHAEFQDLLQRRDPLTLGDATLSEARAIRRFYENTDRLLGWIADILMPRGVSALSENNFAAIFTALAANGFPANPPAPG